MKSMTRRPSEHRPVALPKKVMPYGSLAMRTLPVSAIESPKLNSAL